MNYAHTCIRCRLTLFRLRKRHRCSGPIEHQEIRTLQSVRQTARLLKAVCYRITPDTESGATFEGPCILWSSLTISLVQIGWETGNKFCLSDSAPVRFSRRRKHTPSWALRLLYRGGLRESQFLESISQCSTIRSQCLRFNSNIMAVWTADVRSSK